MKKVITILIICVIAVSAAIGIFAMRNNDSSSVTANTDNGTAINSDITFIQYRIYAPLNSEVTLDGKAVPYNEDIDCYAAEVKKQGKYTLTVSHEGCETLEEKVNVSMSSNEFVAELTYTDDFSKEAVAEAEIIIDSLIKKCWSLDYDLSEYNFCTEEERLQAEAIMADAVSTLEENLSAEYTVGEIDVNSTVSLSSDTDKLISSERSALFFSFDTQYTYKWQYKADSYEDSGVMTRQHRPQLFIEKIDGEWYIRSLHISLNNSNL